MEEISESVNEWSSLPLCSGYLAVSLERLAVQVEQDGNTSDRLLLWALGVLGGGEYEVLGGWPNPAASESGWQEVFEDLQVRGVQRIRIVLSGESTGLLAALNVAYPGTVFRSADCQSEAFSGLPHRYHHLVRAGVDAVPTLQRRAIRAVTRHGRFSDLADATAFVIDALVRGERCIGVAGNGNVVTRRLHAVGHS